MIQQLASRFKPKVEMIKICIGDLIQDDYMKRDQEQKVGLLPINPCDYIGSLNSSMIDRYVFNIISKVVVIHRKKLFAGGQT